jgi:hypothetical protein
VTTEEKPMAEPDGEPAEAQEGGSAGGAFEREAARAAGRSGGPLGEFRYFLARTRKWWMAPIIVALLLIGTLLVMSTSAVAPLIYALF